MWLTMREQGDFAYVPERLVRYRTTPPSERMMKYAKGYRISGGWWPSGTARPASG